MIGFIFNTLESVVCEQLGEDTWDELLEQTDNDGVFHSLGNYPDEQVVNLVVAAAKKLDKTPAEVLRWFGEHAIAEFYSKWPEIFQRFDNLFEYILSLNDIIHPQVKQLYPEAKVPFFKPLHQSDDRLLLEYVSARKMCHLAEGLISGSAKHFNTPVVIHQPQCIHSGSETCHLSIALLKNHQ
jgi:hypothetical protein